MFLGSKSKCQTLDSVNYSIFFNDCCSNKTPIGTFYSKWFVQDENENKYFPKNNWVKLDNAKSYFLVSTFMYNVPIKININNQTTIDTFQTSCLQYKYPDNLFTWMPIHLVCSDTINGNYSEYYFNGKLRLKGNFLHGKIVDSLNTYFLSGNLQSTAAVDGKHVSYKTFFQDRKLEYIYDSKLKHKIQYTIEGKIRSKYSNKNGNSFYKYDRGNLRSKKKGNKEFIWYSNGKLQESLTRKPLYLLQRLKFHKKNITYNYCWTKYDSLGLKTKEIMFYSKDNCSLNSNHLYGNADEFSLVTYYSLGKKKIVISPIYYHAEDENIPVLYYLFEYENGKYKSSKDLLPGDYEKLMLDYEKDREKF